MAHKYLVISPNNYGNVGDDICAYAGKKAIEKVDPKAEVIVSQPPMDVGLIKWADYVILSGGGIIYDRAWDNVANYMQYIDKAHELGKKSAVLGVGVQGVVTEEGKQIYRETLEKCEFVSVRTEEDKKLLDETGFTKGVASFDIAYFTPDMLSDIPVGLWKRLKAQRLNTKLKMSTKPKFGICMINLRMLKGDSYDGSPFADFDSAIEDFINNGRDKFDIYLMQHAKEDGKLMKALADKYNVTFVPYKDITDLPSLFKLYKSLDGMLGVRLHSIALGLMSKKPVIGIGSATAKQLRLANYGLPTLKKQFFTFGQVEKLQILLGEILDSTKMPISRLSNDEFKYIEEKNNINLELLKKMIND
jgi:polysaccharide pyruvyl transferase WcaK-like protein